MPNERVTRRAITEFFIGIIYNRYFATHHTPGTVNYKNYNKRTKVTDLFHYLRSTAACPPPIIYCLQLLESTLRGISGLKTCS